MKKLVIDLPDHLHTKIKLYAYSQGLTMQQLSREMVQDFLKKRTVIMDKHEFNDAYGDKNA